MTPISDAFLLLPNLFLSIFNNQNVNYDASSNTCIVYPTTGGDDAPAIIQAFAQCGQGGTIQFLNTTYNIATFMNTTGLNNVYIDLPGTLLWGTNFTYWTSNSSPVGFQNRSSAWFLGGDNVTFDGHGIGTLNGNGQAWYDFVDGVNNYPGRPQALAIWETKNSVFQGLKFIQSQMWSVLIMHSENVLMQDIFVNNTSNNDKSDQNSDGADTLSSNNVTFRRWYVENGDDSISAKANSTNIFIEDSVFKRGFGVALGSVGQYPGEFDIIDGVYAKNITCINTRYAGYIKTWTGVQKGYPPNGGGGGTGYIRNIELTNFTFRNSKFVFDIGQCTSYNFQTGGCDTSTIEISNVTVGPIKGTVAADPKNISLQCSGAAPCSGISMDMDLTWKGKAAGTTVKCSNVVDPTGFTCQ